MSVARRLSRLGLRKTLVAVHTDGRFAISRIKSIDEQVDLKPVAKIPADDAPVIGRVGVPDPNLGIAFTRSMPFYGKWFDELGETDAGYYLRRGITSHSHEALLDQIRRDDQYALVGSYYSVFRTIMAAKGRVPLVLICDRYLDLDSFPVVLPAIEDEEMNDELQAVLSRMIRPDQPVPEEIGGATVPGIDVDEISAEELGRAMHNTPS